MPINVAIIGFGRMGEMFLREIIASNHLHDKPVWKVSYICDTNENSRLLAAHLSPSSVIVEDEDVVFADPQVQVVILSALSDSRGAQIEKAVSSGKCFIAEKPISDNIDNEWRLVKLLNSHPEIISTVNLPLRNAWFNKEIKAFLDSGELGQLAIVRICHLTPGLAPGEGHAPEGPCFHDCGMHYVDFARWYAGSEYKTWHAQAVDFWDNGAPWWLQCHGTFENGVTFDITQGHCYGQLSKDLVHFSYNDIIGTKGIARMYHDFKRATIEMHGVTKTIRKELPFGDKNLNVLLDLFSKSVSSKVLNPELPSIKDSVIASEYAWRFLEDARKNDLPVIGDHSELEKILERRRNLTNGYGLLRHK